MRVLVITSMFPHGKNRTRGWSVFQRTVALAARCELKVVSPQTLDGLEPREVLQGIEVTRPHWWRVPKLGVVVDGYRYAAAAWPAVEQIRASFDFDLIDAHWTYPDGFAAVRLGRRVGRPVVLSARGTDVNEFCFRWPVRHFARRALRGAAELVAVSSQLKEKMVGIGLPAERITVVPNAVDTALFHPGDRDAARRALGLSADETALLTAGTLVEAKGFQDLIAGLARLGPQPPVRLFVAGVGPFGRALEAVAAEKGVADRVEFLGRLSHAELTRWYQAADLFCFGSWREGCPNVIIESLACGTPVVSTGVGAVPDLVEPGRDGLLFEPRSAAAFARTLQEALSRTWDRAAIAARGSRRSWDQVAGEYLAVFERALSGWKPGS